MLAYQLSEIECFAYIHICRIMFDSEAKLQILTPLEYIYQSSIHWNFQLGFGPC